MVDKLTPERRSWNMSRIRSRSTKPELIVRSLLHQMGFRFRLTRKDLAGKPDIVLPKYTTVIFVHGCFWHRHQDCKGATTPSTRREFWQKKFYENVERDRRNHRELRKAGWNVIVVWECEVRADPAGVARNVAETLAHYSIVASLPEKSEILRVAEDKMRYHLAQKK